MVVTFAMTRSSFFLPRKGSQVTSKVLTLVDERQGRLDLSRRAEPNTVPIELVRRQRSAGAALSLAITSSGLDDQEICDAIKVDAGYLSRMKKGQATLQGDLVAPFCDMVGNRVYPEWIAFQVGCTLVQIQTEAERRAAAAERELQEEREKVRLLTEIIQGKAA